MAKLSSEHRFLDLSDYGRAIAIKSSKLLKNTKTTPIHITLVFGVFGLISAAFILREHYVLAGIFLILKSIIDAMDGELAREKNTPSYTGRYLDSVFDIILNFIFLVCIGVVTASQFWMVILAFFCIQLQGTLYNYYYVILRNTLAGGDSTSKIFEYKSPNAMQGESQKNVDFLFKAYLVLYGIYDRIIHYMDKNAYRCTNFPSWFMTFVSVYGLGFQLLIMAVMMSVGWVNYILPFFILYSILIFVMIIIRKTYFK